jgi:site-specific DNA-methyltransferase (adenine-specific)
LVSAVMYSSKTGEHATPLDLYSELDREFSFVCDVAATSENAKHHNYFTKEMDGLSQDWTKFGGACFANPPYGRGIGAWVQKARRTSLQGTTVVCLLPSRTDVAWWHDYIWDRDNDCPQGGVEVRFIKGRLKFGGSKNSAPFPSVVVIFHGRAR